MKMKFSGKKISGILSVLPETEIKFEDEVGNYSFPENQTMRLKKIMGYGTHRLAKPATTPSEMSIFGIDYLLKQKLLDWDEICAIVTVSITPDYWLPHISNIIHGHYNLNEDILCIDLFQGCCGFVVGLMEAFMLLEHFPDKKVLLVNADVLSHRVSNRDRNSFPLIGDAAVITILENNTSWGDTYYNCKADGSRCDALIIPAGGTKMPSDANTAELVSDEDGNFRSLDNMKMDGSAVFTFAQTEVPLLIDEALNDVGVTREDISWFLLHQPNRFMLKKIAERIGVAADKMPMNIVERFGNPSGASIPLAITNNLSKEMTGAEKKQCCLCAFGSGLTWGTMIMELGNMDFCENIISDR